jgi:hypothetical protein
VGIVYGVLIVFSIIFQVGKHFYMKRKLALEADGSATSDESQQNDKSNSYDDKLSPTNKKKGSGGGYLPQT